MSNEPGQALREHPGACSTDPATRIGDHIGTRLRRIRPLYGRGRGFPPALVGNASGSSPGSWFPGLSPTRSTLGRSAGSTCGSCNGRSPTLNGRRQPSRGGTSGMIARFTDRTGHRGPLTSAIIAWARDEATRATPITWARRPTVCQVSRPDRARHRSVRRPFGRVHRRLTSHIYTDGVQEIGELLAAARRLPPQGTLRPAASETLFGSIAATGLRLSEALHLRCSDIDLGCGQLTVRQTKFCKSRLVPLHPTAVRERHIPSTPEAPFLCRRPGAGAQEHSANVFGRIRAGLGWTVRGSQGGRRLQNLGHTRLVRRPNRTRSGAP